jgi:NAD(P)H dehydrogenase (quinone)
VTQPTVFVSGANGKLGRRVIELLRERGYGGRIIAGTRNPAAVTSPGVEVRKADFNDPLGLAKALDGVDRMLLVSTDAFGPGRVAEHRNAVDAARAAGVGHIAYTSAPNPDADSPLPLTADHRLTEEAIAASGVPYTILRNMWYTENLLGSLPPVLASGKWYSAAGTGRQAYVTREDTARAAAGALLAASNESRTLTITGPDLLTTQEIAAIASDISGRPLEVIPVTDEQLAAGALSAGVPEFVVQSFIVPFERNTREGRADIRTDAVKQLWGEDPQGVRPFLEANRVALAA